MNGGAEGAKVAVVEICSRFDAACADLAWLDDIRLRAAAWIAADPDRLGAKHLKWARTLAELAQGAIANGDAQGAAVAAIGALQAAWQAEIAEGLVMIQSGVKSYRESEKANIQRASDAKARYAQWQDAANKVWNARPELSATSVAKKIAANCMPCEPDNKAPSVGTIRQHIKNPHK